MTRILWLPVPPPVPRTRRQPLTLGGKATSVRMQRHRQCRTPPRARGSLLGQRATQRYGALRIRPQRSATTSAKKWGGLCHGESVRLTARHYSRGTALRRGAR